MNFKLLAFLLVISFPDILTYQTECIDYSDCENQFKSFGTPLLEFTSFTAYLGPYPRCVIKCPSQLNCINLVNSIQVTYFFTQSSSNDTLASNAANKTSTYAYETFYNGSHIYHNNYGKSDFLVQTPSLTYLKFIQCGFTFNFRYPNSNLTNMSEVTTTSHYSLSNDSINVTQSANDSLTTTTTLLASSSSTASSYFIASFSTNKSINNPSGFYENQSYRAYCTNCDALEYYRNLKPEFYLYKSNSTQLRFRFYAKCSTQGCPQKSSVKIFGLDQSNNYYYISSQNSTVDNMTIYYDSEADPFLADGLSLIFCKFYPDYMHTLVSNALNLSSQAFSNDLVKYLPYLPYLQNLNATILPVIINSTVSLRAFLNYNGPIVSELNDLSSIGVGFNVYWFADEVNQAISFTNTSFSSNISISNTNGTYMVYFDFSTLLSQSLWSTYINKKIYCKIYPTLNGIESPISFGYHSYYLGIVVDYIKNTDSATSKSNGNSIILFDGIKYVDTTMNKISLSEGTVTDTIVRVYSTIPVVCVQGKSVCSLEFQMTTIDLAGNEDLIRVAACSNNVCKISGCRSVMKNTDKTFDSNTNASWAIIPTIDTENILQKKIAQFQITVSASDNVNGAFWNSVASPKINVEFLPKQRPLTQNAYCTDDPHCKTFDQNYFEFQYRDGEYVVYENTKSQLWVHLISESCIKIKGFIFNYCIKGIYIQSIDDYVSFEINRIPALHYIDLSSANKTVLPLIWRDEIYTLPKSVSIQIKQDDYNYYIISHFGVTITIQKAGYMFNIIPSKLDSGKVNGLFGNYNNNPSDDFSTARDGSLVNSQNDFFDSFKVNSSKQLSDFKFYSFKTASSAYNESNDDNSNDNNSLGNKNYCKCNKVTPSCSQSISKEKAKKSKNKRLSSPTTQVALSASFNLSQFEQPIVQTDNDTCEQTLKNNPSLVYCNQSGIINLDEIIQNCKNDFNSTRVDIWPARYLNAQQAKCKFIISSDQQLQQSTVNGNGETVYSLPTEVAAMCLNNCSGKGTCDSTGICQCNTGYTGIDCSIDLNRAPNITHNTFKNNMCDTRTQSCYELFFRGSGFSDSSNANAAFNVTIYDPIKSTIKNRTYLDTSNVFVVNSEIVFLKLNNPTTKVSRFSMNKNRIDASVSSINFTMRTTLTFTNNIVNGTTFSNDVTLLVYDSLCNECTSVTSCTLKPSTCYIDNYCYADGDTNGNVLVCNSKNNKYDWTPVTSGASNLNNFHPFALIILNLIILYRLFSF